MTNIYVKEFYMVWKKHGKSLAKEYYPQTWDYLQDKWLKMKWRNIWK